MTLQIQVPDCWKVVKISHNGEIFYKVFSGYYGGYTTGDSWKLNSGISSYKEYPTYYEFMSYSGSICRCYKTHECMNQYMHSVYTHFQNQVGKSKFKTITMKTFKRNYAES